MTIRFRPIEPADNRDTSEILAAAIDDLSLRKGVQGNSTADLSPDDAWALRRPLWDHLAATAAFGWLAEDEGRAVGYARSILRDGLLELTEFFVRPEAQNGGVGRELLARAFPAGSGRSGSGLGSSRSGAGASGLDVRARSIIATSDLRALSRYLQLGVGARFPIYAFARRPDPISVPTDLAAQPLGADPAGLAHVASLDLAILGHRRDADHRFLAAERAGWLYRRAGQPVAYGYHGRWQGPFAALDPADLPAILGAAEAAAAAAGSDKVEFEVPLVNSAAVGWLLGRGYRLDPFFTFLMSDVEFGQFDRYVLTSPPIFL